MINHLPYPKGSVVKFKTKDNRFECGTKRLWYISEVSDDGDYYLVSHGDHGIAWVDHKDLIKVSDPTIESWNTMLKYSETAY